MARIFINHRVLDYDKWRPAHDVGKPRRAAAGLIDVAVLRDADNLNSVWVVCEGERASVEGMFRNPNLESLMEAAGLMAPPEIWSA